jgi:hypothetical protein
MVSLDAPAPSLSLSQTSSDIRFGDRNPALTHRHRRLLTQKRIFSPKLEQVVTHCNAILFQLVYSPTDQSISTHRTAVGILSLVEFANKASHYQYVMGKSRPKAVPRRSILLCNISYCTIIMTIYGLY